MPTYEYKCTQCGHRFEVFQSMKDERLTECPVEACGGTVRRLIGTGAGIIFKGSGFYQTDYRSDSYKQAAKSESGGGDSTAPAAPAPASTATPAAPVTPAPAASTAPASGAAD